jgi:hypothetical protein
MKLNVPSALLMSLNVSQSLKITSDQSINLLQMLAALLCGEKQIVPEIYGKSIFLMIFMKFGQEKS